MKVTQSNKHVLDFQVAIRETKDITTFVRCQAWEKTADYIDQYATKGSNLAISGALKSDKYQDKNGNNVEKVYVKANNVEILDHRKGDLEKKNEQYGYEPSQTEPSQDVDISPADLPFY